MKKDLLFYSVLTLIVGLIFTSCSKDDDYWVNSSIDMPFLLQTEKDGYFEPSAMYEFKLSDLTNIKHSREDIREIRLTDTWIEIRGNFVAGDVIEGLEIYIEGIGTHKVPKIRIANNGTSFTIDNTDSPGLFAFMADAMDKLDYTGKVHVTCSGFYNVAWANIDIIIKNDLRVLVSD